jgi:hypothetical protein
MEVVPMPSIKIGVREFCERIARFLESDAPIAVTHHGKTLGVDVPTPRKSVRSADLTELRAAADRLADAFSSVDEEEVSRRRPVVICSVIPRLTLGLP